MSVWYNPELDEIGTLEKHGVFITDEMIYERVTPAVLRRHGWRCLGEL